MSRSSQDAVVHSPWQWRGGVFSVWLVASAVCSRHARVTSLDKPVTSSHPTPFQDGWAARHNEFLWDFALPLFWKFLHLRLLISWCFICFFFLFSLLKLTKTLWEWIKTDFYMNTNTLKCNGKSYLSTDVWQRRFSCIIYTNNCWYADRFVLWV